MSRFIEKFRNVVIQDQENQARTSAFDGQRFFLRSGDTTTVENAPVLSVVNDGVSFANRGLASTTGLIPTAPRFDSRGLN